MDEIIIRVSREEDNGGYGFYVYEGEAAYFECDCADGGLCTTSMENALEMAVEAAKGVSRKKR